MCLMVLQCRHPRLAAHQGGKQCDIASLLWQQCHIASPQIHNGRTATSHTHIISHRHHIRYLALPSRHWATASIPALSCPNADHGDGRPVRLRAKLDSTDMRGPTTRIDDSEYK